MKANHQILSNWLKRATSILRKSGRPELRVPSTSLVLLGQKDVDARHKAGHDAGESFVNLGFVGLGAMGQLIVPRLMAAGHKVTGWNRSRDKAATLLRAGMLWAEDPRTVAEQSEIVFSIVTDAKAVKAVALGKDGI